MSFIKEASIFEVKSKSDKAANISAVVLSENDAFRKLLVSELVRDSPTDKPKIKIAIVTERKNRKGTWEPVEHIPVSRLKAKESQAVHLDSATTEKLLAQLGSKFTVIPKGILIIGDTAELDSLEKKKGFSFLDAILRILKSLHLMSFLLEPSILLILQYNILTKRN